MRICEDGIIRDMTQEEIASLKIEEAPVALTPEEEVAQIQQELAELQNRLASLMSQMGGNK